MNGSAQHTPLLEVRGVSKRFAGVRALDNVSLTLQRGEVLALVGENGAGKSTLMKILAGVQPPDAGELLFEGQPTKLTSVESALGLGIALIHQELNLADKLDVASNIVLGREPRHFAHLIDFARMHREARTFLDMVGLKVPTQTIVNQLTIGRQQMVEIAKALSVNARVLIMDEPTSSLSSAETTTLFGVIKELRSRGVSVIYISHRLGEVKELADRVVVLRDGANAGHLDRADITHDNMVRLMVGRDISQFYARKQHQPGGTLLEVRDLATPAWPQHRLNFAVRAGEIVGIAGLVGAGRTDVMRTLFGIDRPVCGQVIVGNRALTGGDPVEAIDAGVMLVPEDRKDAGLLIPVSIRRNIGLPGLWRHRRAKAFLDHAREARDCDEMIRKLRIKTFGGDQVAETLSGGNQQKVAIAKWLALGPRVLLLDEPTRGVDIGAKQEIYALMEDLAGRGMAVLFVSSDMEEILGMSDRTLVMHEGRVAGELSRDQLSEESIMRLATGERRAA